MLIKTIRNRMIGVQVYELLSRKQSIALIKNIPTNLVYIRGKNKHDRIQTMTIREKEMLEYKKMFHNGSRYMN